MASLLSRSWLGISALAFTACASSLPSNFEYKTSLRGEQGFLGRADRVAAAEQLLRGGVVKDPALALQSALPNTDVRLRTWGLRYFDSDWTRYQVVMDADIRRDDKALKCRNVSTDDAEDAPTLQALLANDGAAFQRDLDKLIAACARQFKDLT